MNKWMIWTVICIICVSILLYVGTFFRYPGRTIKAHTSIGQGQQKHYLLGERIMEKGKI
ncbi:MAG: hypothetical protein AB2421_19890 [Thermotaleaceae bacterium]